MFITIDGVKGIDRNCTEYKIAKSGYTSLDGVEIEGRCGWLAKYNKKDYSFTAFLFKGKKLHAQKTITEDDALYTEVVASWYSKHDEDEEEEEEEDYAKELYNSIEHPQSIEEYEAALGAANELSGCALAAFNKLYEAAFYAASDAAEIAEAAVIEEWLENERHFEHLEAIMKAYAKEAEEFEAALGHYYPAKEAHTSETAWDAYHKATSRFPCRITECTDEYVTFGRIDSLGKFVCVQKQTGGGKTTWPIKAAKEGKRVLIVAHLIRILDSVVSAASQEGVELSHYSRSSKEELLNTDRLAITINSLGKLNERKVGFNIIVFDEINNIIDILTNPTSHIKDKQSVIDAIKVQIKTADKVVFQSAHIDAKHIDVLKRMLDIPIEMLRYSVKKKVA